MIKKKKQWIFFPCVKYARIYQDFFFHSSSKKNDNNHQTTTTMMMIINDSIFDFLVVIYGAISRYVHFCEQPRKHINIGGSKYWNFQEKNFGTKKKQWIEISNRNLCSIFFFSVIYVSSNPFHYSHLFFFLEAIIIIIFIINSHYLSFFVILNEWQITLLFIKRRINEKCVDVINK